MAKVARRIRGVFIGVDRYQSPEINELLWVPKTCAAWADALRDAGGSVTRTVPGGQVLVRAGVR
jgi:hypothetical protein